MTSTIRNHLSLYLVAIISSWHYETCVGTQGVSTKKPLCSFPSFLQESCSEASKTCRHWSQGRRLEYGGNNAFYERESARSERKGEFLWVFKGRKLEISAADSLPSRINPHRFYCWQKLAPHIFIISSKNATNKSDSNVKYSCVKFRKRGRNVIEYLQSLWMDNSTNLACNESDLIPNENPLILATMPQQLPDCPTELNGGFQIVQLYNGKTDEQCSYNNYTDIAMFESDCLGKEGLMIQLPAQRDCSLRRREYAIDTGMFHLEFHCYSTPWKDEQFTYFIVKRRLKRLTRNAFTETTESDFLCARFQKVVNESDGEIQVEFFDKPTCWRNVSAASIFLNFHLKRRITLDQPARAPYEINETECSFPEKFQGIWREISQQNGLQTVVINKTAVDIPPYGRFHCKRQHFFQYQAPYKCSSLVSGKWPGTERAKFYMDDYLLLSNFSNGCHPRITRFGITDVIWNDILAYRLSQSVRITREEQTSDEYFNFHILRQFCSSWLPYMKDPYPIWGRNIEKIVMKNPVRSQQPCLLPAFGKGVYHFKSVHADQSECHGPESRVQFGCDGSLKIKVKYDPSCRKPDVSFACIGKAWKIGEFSIVQDTKSKSISCMWFDKENNQLLRLNSPQCSDIDFGKRPWEERTYAEKFVLKYYGKCPIIPDTKTIGYPVVIRRRNASHSFHLFPSFSISSCLLIVIMFCSTANEM